MSATSTVRIQLTSFIIQISSNSQNSKIFIIGKMTEEYLQTKPHTSFFILNALVIK